MPPLWRLLFRQSERPFQSFQALEELSVTRKMCARDLVSLLSLDVIKIFLAIIRLVILFLRCVQCDQCVTDRRGQCGGWLSGFHLVLVQSFSHKEKFGTHPNSYSTVGDIFVRTFDCDGGIVAGVNIKIRHFFKFVLAYIQERRRLAGE